MSDPVTLHTTTRGAGRDIVFVHGLDDDSSCWDGVVDLLEPIHRCTTVDLPGHGRSPSPHEPDAYRREAVLDSLDAAIDAISPTEPVVIVGHSLGGYLALAHAMTRPGRARALAVISAGPGFRDPDSRAAWNDKVQQSASGYSISAAASTIAHHVDSLVIDRLTEVTIPVLVAVGSDDRRFVGAAEYLGRKLPNSHMLTVPEARHFVIRSHPRQIADAVDRLSDDP